MDQAKRQAQDLEHPNDATGASVVPLPPPVAQHHCQPRLPSFGAEGHTGRRRPPAGAAAMDVLPARVLSPSSPLSPRAFRLANAEKYRSDGTHADTTRWPPLRRPLGLRGSMESWFDDQPTEMVLHIEDTRWPTSVSEIPAFTPLSRTSTRRTRVKGARNPTATGLPPAMSSLSADLLLRGGIVKGARPRLAITRSTAIKIVGRTA